MTRQAARTKSFSRRAALTALGAGAAASFCLPLARNVRALIDGGYALGQVTPIDQFLFSPHVEAVTVLSR